MEPNSPVKKEDKETTVGNYFVSNYPPFSFWKPEHNAALEAALDQPPQPNTPLGLYVHIPFCRKRCHFCYFRVYTGVKSAEIRTYVDGALKELEQYKDRAFLGGRKPEFVYFGGGTPSYLSTAQLGELCDGLKAVLPWDEAREVAFECEPGTLNDRKLQFIRDQGVTRLSLGIENFDEHILEVNGRAHRTQEIEKAYGFARDVGFPQINIDLIAGMMDETEENWKRNIEKTLEYAPDSVTIYQMEIPFNTTIYKQMQEAGRFTAPVADWETKRRWVREAFETLEANGYRVGSSYTAVREDKVVDFVYRDALWQGADLLSLGVASFGHVNGVHYQNQADMDPYLEKVNAGERPVFRAYETDAEERLVREFALQFKLGSIDASYFQAKFGVDVHERFKEGLQRLDEWGYLADRSRLVLTRDGLLEVDRLVHEFFMPQHITDRYV